MIFRNFHIFFLTIFMPICAMDLSIQQKKAVADTSSTSSISEFHNYAELPQEMHTLILGHFLSGEMRKASTTAAICCRIKQLMKVNHQFLKDLIATPLKKYHSSLSHVITTKMFRWNTPPFVAKKLAMDVMLSIIKRLMNRVQINYYQWSFIEVTTQLIEMPEVIYDNNLRVEDNYLILTRGLYGNYRSISGDTLKLISFSGDRDLFLLDTVATNLENSRYIYRMLRPRQFSHVIIFNKENINQLIQEADLKKISSFIDSLEDEYASQIILNIMLDYAIRIDKNDVAHFILKHIHERELLFIPLKLALLKENFDIAQAIIRFLPYKLFKVELNKLFGYFVPFVKEDIDLDMLFEDHARSLDNPENRNKIWHKVFNLIIFFYTQIRDPNFQNEILRSYLYGDIAKQLLENGMLLDFYQL